MSALWKHLKPLPYNQSHSHATLRILGKLGGRNRRVLREVSVLSFDKNACPTLQVPVSFESSKPQFLISLDRSLDFAESILKNGNDNNAKFYQEQAFEFATGCLALFLDTEESKHISSAVKELVEIPLNKIPVESARSRLEAILTKRWQDSGNKTRPLTMFYENTSLQHREAQSKAFGRIIMCLFYAYSVEELADRSKDILEHLTHHFVLLKLAETFSYNPRTFRMGRSNRHLDFLDANLFVDALLEAFCSNMDAIPGLAETLMMEFHNTLLLLTGSAEVITKMPVYHLFASKFCSACYKTEWHRKLGGSRGIFMLADKLALGADWLLDHQLEFVKYVQYDFSFIFEISHL
jgi:transformation/transcription domain-associated protein